MTAEEAQRIIDEFNRKIKPAEDAFMAYVFAYRTLGYGRMIQLIQAHWDNEIGIQRQVNISEGDSKGYVRDVP